MTDVGNGGQILMKVPLGAAEQAVDVSDRYPGKVDQQPLPTPLCDVLTSEKQPG